jgi:hypothetical protein
MVESRPATFAIQVGGTPTFNYSWFKDGIKIPFLNNSTFSLRSMSPADHPGLFLAVPRTDLLPERGPLSPRESKRFPL